MSDIYEFECRVKHKGRIYTHTIVAESTENANVEAALRGKVISVRKLGKINMPESIAQGIR